METAYIVLLKDGAPKDWKRAADLVEQHAESLSRADATRSCRFGHGLILHPLARTESEALAEALQAGGFAAESLSVSEIVPAPRAFGIVRAELQDEGIQVQIDVAGRTSLLPWNVLRMLHIAYVRPGGGKTLLPDTNLKDDKMAAVAEAMLESKRAQTATLTDVTNVASAIAIAALGGPGLMSTYVLHEALEAGPDALPATPQAPKDPEVWLELLALEPLLRLRLARHSFRYDYLGARRLGSGRANFRLLVQDLANGARHAARTGLTSAALTGGDLDLPKLLTDEKDLDLAVTALLTREKRYGLPRPATPQAP